MEISKLILIHYFRIFDVFSNEAKRNETNKKTRETEEKTAINKKENKLLITPNWKHLF